MRPQEISKTLDIPRERVLMILQQHYPDRPNRQVARSVAPDELPDATKDEIISLWRSGTSLSKLAEKYNMVAVTLRNWLMSQIPADEYAARSAQQPTLKRAISKDDIPNIVNAYLAGKEIRDIAKDYGVNYNAIKYHLMQQGMSQLPSTKSFAHDVRAEDIDRMVTMRKNGKTMNQIAGIMNIPIGTVRHYLAGRV